MVQIVQSPLYYVYRGGTKMCEKWLFNGADMDQGLLFHRFVLNRGSATLIDTDLGQVKRFEKGFMVGYNEKDSKPRDIAAVSASDALSGWYGSITIDLCVAGTIIMLESYCYM